jgi:phosphodiesterase/alkaline phosphatase D-like protein
MRDTFTIARPTIVTVNNLQACTTYELRLLAEDEGATDPKEEFVAAAHFSTRCESRPLTLAVLSCDRFADDPEDDDFVWQLAETLQKERTFMTLHLGDQVYADKIFEKYGESSLEDVSLGAIGEELRAFRTWGLKEAQSRPCCSAQCACAAVPSFCFGRPSLAMLGACCFSGFVPPCVDAPRHAQSPSAWFPYYGARRS